MTGKKGIDPADQSTNRGRSVLDNTYWKLEKDDNTFNLTIIYLSITYR